MRKRGVLPIIRPYTRAALTGSTTYLLIIRISALAQIMWPMTGSVFGSHTFLVALGAYGLPKS